MYYLSSCPSSKKRHHYKTFKEVSRHKQIREITSQYPLGIKLFNKASYNDYVISQGKEPPCPNIYDDIDALCSHISVISDIDETSVYDDLRQQSINYKQKQYRNNKKVEFLLNSDCIFLTLTFTNKTLESTSATTRRRYVRAYLNSLGCYFLGNIDFGERNHREHYHALVQASEIDYSAWHKFGAIKGKKCNIDSSSKDITRYICKLSNHSIKTSTSNKRVLCNLPRDIIACET